MKKVLCLILALIMVLSLVACGNNSSTTTDDKKSETTDDKNTENTTTTDDTKTEDNTAADGETIKLAVVGPMTGQDAEYGLGFRQAAQIMANKWNEEKGGVLGKKVELVVYDDKGTAEESANVAEQIVANKDIVAVIGHFSSSCSMAAAPIYQDNGMLEISPTSSHADFTGIGDWIWRVSPLTTDEGHSVAKFIVNYLKAKKVGILIMNNDWGVEIAQIEKETILELDPEVEITEQTVVEGNDDYGPVVTNFISAGVEVVTCCSTYTITAPFLKQLRTANPDVFVMSHGNCQVQQVTDILGADGNNYTCSCSWSPIFTDEDTAYFVQKYSEMDANDTTPIGDYAQYYDTVGVILQAIENVGSTDREAIREELATIEYDGLSGHIKFDENRDCPRDYGFVYWDTSDNAWHQNTEWNAA